VSSAPRIGISSCLLGERVRYDGAHKKNEYITESLGRCFEFVPFCPEVAIGMGVPRPPIRLVRVGSDIRARGVRDAELDVTEPLRDYAVRVAPKLKSLSGYILKKDSPSCGMERVRVHGAQGVPRRDGAGIFAQRLMELVPQLPFEEEGRLMDPALRENFVERVYVYHRWRQRCTPRLSAKALVEFHTRHKFIVLAHDETVYRALGRLVAGAGRGSLAEVRSRYLELLMNGLRKPATRARTTNVLQHVFGFFKKRLEADDKREMVELIENYRRGHVPLIVPITMLRHYLRRFPDPYLSGQYFLAPDPDEVMLRNQI
jgi:uncharacterized protein YbgA (DUF1722 family)/uncharacterized protein YbbK (DUF523 family)